MTEATDMHQQDLYLTDLKNEELTEIKKLLSEEREKNLIQAKLIDELREEVC